MKTSVLLVSMIFLYAGCSDNSVNTIDKKIPGSLSYEDYWSFVNKPGQTGTIELGFILHQEPGYNFGLSDTSEYYYYAKSKIFKTPDSGKYLAVDSIFVNNIQLKDNQDGANTFLTYGFPNNETDLNLYYSNNNTIKNLSNKHIPFFDTSLVLNPAVRFEYIQNGDKINKNTSLNLTWNSVGSEMVYIELTRESSEISGFQSLNGYTNNNGFMNIPESDLSALDNGKYSLLIRKYQPFWVNLSNGKTLRVISISEHKIIVYLE